MIEFIQKHCERFGYSNQKDQSMILEWASVHTKNGIDVEDLEEASKKMLTDSTITFTREQHLQKMNSILFLLRDKKRTYQTTHISAAGYRCENCKDACGIVSVPDLRQVDGGDWKGNQTMAVVCICKDGFKWMNTRNLKDQPIMTLGQYQNKNPFWKRMLKEREQERKNNSLTMERARELDGKANNGLDNAIRNILSRISK